MPYLVAISFKIKLNRLQYKYHTYNFIKYSTIILRLFPYLFYFFPLHIYSYQHKKKKKILKKSFQIFDLNIILK